MPNYHVFIRVQDQQQAGKGAAPGDVVSVRPSSDKITNTEKKRLLILKVSLTAQELEQLQKQIRPRTSFEHVGTPPTDPAAYEAYMFAMAAEKKMVNSYGKRVELTTANFTQKQLDEIRDLNKSCEPIPKDKAVIKEPETAGP